MFSQEKQVEGVWELLKISLRSNNVSILPSCFMGENAV